MTYCGGKQLSWFIYGMVHLWFKDGLHNQKMVSIHRRWLVTPVKGATSIRGRPIANCYAQYFNMR